MTTHNVGTQNAQSTQSKIFFAAFAAFALNVVAFDAQTSKTRTAQGWSSRAAVRGRGHSTTT